MPLSRKIGFCHLCLILATFGLVIAKPESQLRNEGDKCDDHTDCGRSLMCAFKSRLCSRLCFSDDDCSIGNSKCIEASCPPNMGEIAKENSKKHSKNTIKSRTTCDSNDDCGYTQDCFLGHCADHCKSDDDCQVQGTVCKYLTQSGKYIKEHDKMMLGSKKQKALFSETDPPLALSSKIGRCLFSSK